MHIIPIIPRTQCCSKPISEHVDFKTLIFETIKDKPTQQRMPQTLKGEK